MQALPKLRSSLIAIVTILAMLVVPACGSLCSTMSHCSSTIAAADSECHHAEMLQQTVSVSFSSQVSCGQQTPLLAILSASDSSSIQVDSVVAAVTPVSIGVSVDAVAVHSRFGEFLSSKDSPQQSIPLENLSVLRV